MTVPPRMENAIKMEYDVPDVQRHKHHIPAKKVAEMTIFNLPYRSLRKPTVGLPITIPRLAKAPKIAPWWAVSPIRVALSGSENRTHVYPITLRNIHAMMRSSAGRFKRRKSNAF